MLEWQERAGASLPWPEIQKCLAPDERFHLRVGEKDSLLLAPKESSRCSAVLFHLREKNISPLLVGRGSLTKPVWPDHPVILSTRALQQMEVQEGVLAVEAGCSMKDVNSFLFERKWELGWEDLRGTFSNGSIAGLYFGDGIEGLCLAGRPPWTRLLGAEGLQLDGSRLKFGSSLVAARGGPQFWRERLRSGEYFLTRFFIELLPLAEERLYFSWESHGVEASYQKLKELSTLLPAWERLDHVFSTDPKHKTFILGQISGTGEECQQLRKRYPQLDQAVSVDQADALQQFLSRQKLRAVACEDDKLREGAYYWRQWNGRRLWEFVDG